MGFGAALGNAFTEVGKDLALAALGVAFLALVVMGLTTFYSILDPRATGMVKSAMIKVIAGSAIIGAAGLGAAAAGRIATGGAAAPAAAPIVIAASLSDRPLVDFIRSA